MGLCGAAIFCRGPRFNWAAVTPIGSENCAGEIVAPALFPMRLKFSEVSKPCTSGAGGSCVRAMIVFLELIAPVVVGHTARRRGARSFWKWCYWERRRGLSN